MTHGFDIAFAQPPLRQSVAFAIAPFDGFTGERVVRGVTARIDGLSDLPVRNVSGMLVFTDLPMQPVYTIRIDAAVAGYFNPPATSIAAGDPSGTPFPVALGRLPSRGHPDDATLVRGLVQRAGVTVANAQVVAALDPPPPGATPFATRSDGAGSFAIALRLPRLAPGEQEAPYGVLVSVTDSVGTAIYPGQVRGGRAHRFAAPLDLASAATPSLDQI